jgi:hypothetical protein
MLVDATGREYPAIAMVSESAPKTETTTLDFSPGVTLKVRVRFDGPRQTHLTAIELHDSASSAGARVSV